MPCSALQGMHACRGERDHSSNTMQLHPSMHWRSREYVLLCLSPPGLQAALLVCTTQPYPRRVPPPTQSKDPVYVPATIFLVTDHLYHLLVKNYMRRDKAEGGCLSVLREHV